MKRALYEALKKRQIAGRCSTLFDEEPAARTAFEMDKTCRKRRTPRRPDLRSAATGAMSAAESIASLYKGECRTRGRPFAACERTKWTVNEAPVTPDASGPAKAQTVTRYCPTALWYGRSPVRRSRRGSPVTAWWPTLRPRSSSSSGADGADRFLFLTRESSATRADRRSLVERFIALSAARADDGSSGSARARRRRREKGVTGQAAQGRPQRRGRESGG